MLRYECEPWCPPLSRTRALPDADFAGFPTNQVRGMAVAETIVPVRKTYPAN